MVQRQKESRAAPSQEGLPLASCADRLPAAPSAPEMGDAPRDIGSAVSEAEVGLDAPLFRGGRDS